MYLGIYSIHFTWLGRIPHQKQRCDATADVDDVLIPLGLTGLTYIGIKNSEVRSTRIGPRSAPWEFGYDPANTIGGEKGGDIHYSSLETWFPSSRKCGILIYITYI
jgi:hypothetical protein